MTTMPKLMQTYFVDVNYSQNHAHMLHKHPDVLEILYIDSGEGRYIVGKREYAVSAGDVVICNAGMIHGEAPFQKHEIQTYCCALSQVMIPGLPENCLMDSRYKPVLAMGNAAGHMGCLMRTMHELFTENMYKKDVCQHLAQAVYLLVKERLEQYKDGGREVEDQKKEFLVRQITDYIDRHYTEPLTLKELSDRFYISPSSISHIYKRETGVSPMQYVIHRRIGEAQTLLMDTHIPIHMIEERLGFGSSCHFSAMFKKYVGISPKEFRSHFK